MHDAETDGRRHRAHALGEVPHRQPLLEQFGAIGDQQVDAIGQGRGSVDRRTAVEGAADREVEGSGVEIGKIGEVLEQRPARNAGDGGDGRGSRLDVTRLNQIQSRLDEALASPQTSDDTTVLRPRYVDRESDNFHIKTNRIRISLMASH